MEKQRCDGSGKTWTVSGVGPFPCPGCPNCQPKLCKAGGDIHTYKGGEPLCLDCGIALHQPKEKPMGEYHTTGSLPHPPVITSQTKEKGGGKVCEHGWPKTSCEFCPSEPKEWVERFDEMVVGIGFDSPSTEERRNRHLAFIRQEKSKSHDEGYRKGLRDVRAAVEKAVFAEPLTPEEEEQYTNEVQVAAAVIGRRGSQVAKEQILSAIDSLLRE